jgi:hypothetical protein
MPAENFAEQERFLQRQEERERDTNQRVLAMLRDEGRPDLADDLTQRLRDIDSGVHGARSTWHSISDAQRRVLLLLGSGPASLRRVGRTYDVVSPLGSRAIGIRLATARNLAARDLLEWTGGAFDPEASGVITEHARFVLKHGSPAPGEHFEGYRP